MSILKAICIAHMPACNLQKLMASKNTKCVDIFFLQEHVYESNLTYMQYTNICAINKFTMQWQHKLGQDFSYDMNIILRGLPVALFQAEFESMV